MVGYFLKKKETKAFMRKRKQGADFFLGQKQENPNKGIDEVLAPYKLEPSLTDIEDFLTRLRQEGL